MTKPVVTKSKARLLQPNSVGQSSSINVDPGAYMQVPDTSKGAKARLLNSGSESQSIHATKN